MTEKLRGWALLHSPLPKEALSPLSARVYGKSGLTDVNEGFLIERLHQSGLRWDLVPVAAAQYIGSEIRREGDPPRDVKYHLASFTGILLIETEEGSGVFRQFAGAGASDNRRVDAAFKGAKTVAFKNACKEAGLTTELYKGGRAMDVIYDEGEPVPPTSAPAGGAAESNASSDGGQTEAKGASAGDAKPAERLPQAQAKTLSYLLNNLPSYKKAEEEGKPESDREWNTERLQQGIRAARARNRNPYEVVFGGLKKAHAQECGKPDCEHVKFAMGTDGHLLYVRELGDNKEAA